MTSLNNKVMNGKKFILKIQISDSPHNKFIRAHNKDDSFVIFNMPTQDFLDMVGQDFLEKHDLHAMREGYFSVSVNHNRDIPLKVHKKIPIQSPYVDF